VRTPNQVATSSISVGSSPPPPDRLTRFDTGHMRSADQPPAHRHQFGRLIGVMPEHVDHPGGGDVVVRLKITRRPDQGVKLLDFARSVMLGESSAHEGERTMLPAVRIIPIRKGTTVCASGRNIAAFSYERR
jgi:hypothetical protein